MVVFMAVAEDGDQKMRAAAFPEAAVELHGGGSNTPFKAWSPVC